MEKNYQPEQIEAHWSEVWRQLQTGQPRGEGQPYSMVIPPPNVTGTLHMGHGFQLTLMDVLIRMHRMQGDKTLWQVGTDHAGIATQMVVERQLAAQGLSRQACGREQFLEHVWQWKEQSGGKITQQMRRLGVSVDWAREHFTLDDTLSEAVRTAFVELYQQGLIYRGKRLVNWDPVLKTAVSDLEVVNEAHSGHLWYVHYPVEDSDERLMIATTRPETLLGDVAVAVHPEDSRYRHLIGCHVVLPIVGRLCPVIADDAVDVEFGTGCVKVTPAHDFNDYAMAIRHQLDMINILEPDGTLNDQVPTLYQGLNCSDARDKVVQTLKSQGFLDRVESHEMTLPKGDRSGAILEPYLTDQWFVKTSALSKEALKVVEDGRLHFHPPGWVNTYKRWLEDIQDWCISRQLWWGHRVPAWYDEASNIYVGHNEEQVRTDNNLSSDVVLRQDEDVLDTWFSSALWPFSSLGWPHDLATLDAYYPTNVLVTGFDIIFFWVARMVMLGLHFTGKVPFHHVYITGLIRDHNGQKMSKSKGNVIDPLSLIDGASLDALIDQRTSGMMQPDQARAVEQATRKAYPQGIAAYGTDALRFTFCALASTGRDIRFDMSRLEGYRNFCNKLWNATRFVTLNLPEQPVVFKAPTSSLEGVWGVMDAWIGSQLAGVIQTVDQAMQNYRFDLVAQACYVFTWETYCDWLLEFAKVQLHTAGPEEKQAVCYTLLDVLETLLRLLHPIIPFVTESLWQSVSIRLGRQSETIMWAQYPCYDSEKINTPAHNEIKWLQVLIAGLRRIRSQMRIAPGVSIPLVLVSSEVEDHQRVARYAPWIKGLVKVASIDWLQEGTHPAASATCVVEGMLCCVPMSGLIDPASERERLDKIMDKLKKALDSAEKRLDNPAYVAKAPPEVVKEEKEGVLEKRAQLEEYQAQKAIIDQL